MSLARPDWLILLMVVPVMCALAFVAVRSVARNRARFLSSDSSRVARTRTRAWRRVARVAAIASLLALGALGPQCGTEPGQVLVAGVDVMVALDVSRSMLAEDEVPNRFERARHEVETLARQVPHGRMGLVTFSGAAVLACPLTRDRASFVEFLREADPALGVAGGTSLGAGVLGAVDAFDEHVDARRVVVLVSDGENVVNVPDPDAVAQYGRSRGVVVHTVLAGGSVGAAVPGVEATSVPDPLPLQRIAAMTGGRFLSTRADTFPLATLVGEELSYIASDAAGTALRDVPVDRYRWPLLIALACMAFSAVPVRVPGSIVGLVSLGVCAMALLGAGDAERKGVALFDAGDLGGARQALEQATRDDPGAASPSFNLGLTLLRLDLPAPAVVEFDRARSVEQAAGSDGSAAVTASASFGAGLARARLAQRSEDRVRALTFLADARRDFALAARAGYGPAAAVNLELVSRRYQRIEQELVDASASASSDGAQPGPLPGPDHGAGRPETGASETAHSPDPSGRSVEGGESGEIGQDGAPQGAAGPVPGSTDVRLPGGMFRAEAETLVDIVRRFERERRALDLERAARSREQVERDW